MNNMKRSYEQHETFDLAYKFSRTGFEEKGGSFRTSHALAPLEVFLLHVLPDVLGGPQE